MNMRYTYPTTSDFFKIYMYPLPGIQAVIHNLVQSKCSCGPRHAKLHLSSQKIPVKSGVRRNSNPTLRLLTHFNETSVETSSRLYPPHRLRLNLLFLSFVHCFWNIPKVYIEETLDTHMHARATTQHTKSLKQTQEQTKHITRLQTRMRMYAKIRNWKDE